MVFDRARLNQYVIGLAIYLYRVGAKLQGDQHVGVDESSGWLRLSVVGILPGPAELNIAEQWEPAGRGRWRRAGYLYDLIDRERLRRRALHWHDAGWFVRHHQVAVHEHCEEVLGTAVCPHYAGLPLLSAHAGIDRLLAAWVSPDPLGCADLLCLKSST